MKIEIKYSKEVADLNSLKQGIEGLLWEKLVFKTDVDWKAEVFY
jgi:hypothetical protein